MTYRILQIMAGAEHGGAEAFFFRLLPALQKRGVAQLAVVRAFPQGLTHLKAAGIPFQKAPFARRFDCVTPWLIQRQIQKFKPDIVLTWMSRASHLCPKTAPDLPFVARLGGYYDLKYYQKADYLVGNTKDIQSYFHQKGWSPEHTAYLPNFADEPSKAPAFDRARYDTPQDAPLLLTLGRLHDDKAFDVLIKAIAHIPRAYLWIGGVGPEEAFLKKLAQDCQVQERVRFIGWHTQTSPLYKACDIYVCPSRIEPLGNVVLEGWAHTKPVVAAMSAGPLGLIEQGVNGFLAPLEDEKTLAHHINDLIVSPELMAQIGQAGRQTIDTYFSENAVVSQYLDFFKRITQFKKGHGPCAA